MGVSAKLNNKYSQEKVIDTRHESDIIQCSMFSPNSEVLRCRVLLNKF